MDTNALQPRVLVVGGARQQLEAVSAAHRRVHIGCEHAGDVREALYEMSDDPAVSVLGLVFVADLAGDSTLIVNDFGSASSRARMNVVGKPGVWKRQHRDPVI